MVAAYAAVDANFLALNTSDQTHPNWDGYDVLGDKAVQIFESVYNAARAAQVGK